MCFEDFEDGPPARPLPSASPLPPGGVLGGAAASAPGAAGSSGAAAGFSSGGEASGAGVGGGDGLGHGKRKRAAEAEEDVRSPLLPPLGSLQGGCALAMRLLALLQFERLGRGCGDVGLRTRTTLLYPALACKSNWA